jgi:2,4-dienoyl-CoA reductase [(3E)-enoyl-CoA-producing], peroxisomal
MGRNVKKAERVTKNIATARKGALVTGLAPSMSEKWKAFSRAVEKCVKELGGIDCEVASAAGNSLALVRSLSPNVFKSVIDIDVLGSYNTAKLTLIESAAKHKVNSHKCKVLLFYSPLVCARTLS